MTDTVVDNVHRAERLGIRVIVVGAGVGGLLTALECWRKGCEVVVLERAANISPLGKERVLLKHSHTSWEMTTDCTQATSSPSHLQA